MKILLTNGSPVPLYEQIKNAVKDNILDGTLQEEAQLPSVRELSRKLKVSILTVKKAYDELEREGLIVVRQGVGSFVSSDPAQFKQEEKQKELERHLMQASQISHRLQLEKKELLELFELIYEGGQDEP